MRHRTSVLALAIGLIAAGSAAGDEAVKSQSVFEVGRAALASNPKLERHPSSVLIQFETGATEGTIAQALQVVKGQIVREYHIVDGLKQIRVGIDLDQAIALLGTMPGVVYAEPDYVRRTTVGTNDTHIAQQWGVNNTGQNIQGINGLNDADIDGFEAWDIYTGDANFVIAIIDTGTQYTHTDLNGNIWSNPGEIAGNGQDDDNNGYVDDIRGWDFYDNDNNPNDSEGHGTHTAGTVGAEGNNGTGVAGVNWQCKLMPLRFLGPGGGYTSDAVAAIQYATDENVKVSNNSWGGGGFSNSLYNAINASKSVGHLFIAAAGNAGQNTDNSPHYPSAYNLDNIISVAGTDNRDRLASLSFGATYNSNYGANTVDLGAPGVDIVSTVTGNGYAFYGGTSMATPHVAGVAALVYAKNPGWTYQQVRDRILGTVRPISALNGKTVTGGVLNAYDAVNNGPPPNQPPTVSILIPASGANFDQGTTINFSATASDPEDGNITSSIVWSSNLDGQLGTGGTMSLNNLSVGLHLITASVTDSGLLTDDAFTTITVNQVANTPPTVSITSPANGSSFAQGASVTFVGVATDPEDGDISSSITWSSSIDGALGSGASVGTSSLSVGTHTITADVVDSNSAPDSDSISVTITGGGTPPGKPGRPTFTDLGGGSVRVMWVDNATNEDDFLVSRAELVGGVWGAWSTIATVGVDVTQYDDSPGFGRFKYRIRARNTAGVSNWSASRAITLSNTTPPGKPGRPTFTDLGGGSVRVMWVDNATNEDDFLVSRAELVGGVWGAWSTIATVGVDVTQYDDSPGFGRFKYRIRARNTAGVSNWSASRAITLSNTTPPGKPGRPDLTDLGGGSVGVVWVDNATNEDDFLVSRAELVGGVWGAWSTIATLAPDTTQYTDTPGIGRFKYRIRARNTAGVSNWSASRAITTQ